MDIGQSLRLALAFRNKKATDLAKETGLGDSYLSLVKRGHRVPSMEVIKIIAESMDYRVSEFIALGETEAE